MQKRILITDKLSSEIATKLEAHPQLHVRQAPTLAKEQLIQEIANYHGVAVRSATKLPTEVLDAASNLQLVVRGGVGIDNIDVAAASERGIAVANTPGANTIATSELTLALMLSLARNLVPAHNAVVRGEWNKGKYAGTELSGKVLGLVGFGRIGREVARRAMVLGMRVLACDPYLESEIFRQYAVNKVDLSEIFLTSDYISLHLPLTAETKYLIGRDAIERMRAGVRLINCARGGLMDHVAVAEALRAGKIAGVGLDVYPLEPPPPDDPLIGLPGVISLPHLGASTREAQQRVAQEVAQTFIDFFIFDKMNSNVVNREKILPRDE